VSCAPAATVDLGTVLAVAECSRRGRRQISAARPPGLKLPQPMDPALSRRRHRGTQNPSGQAYRLSDGQLLPLRRSAIPPGLGRFRAYGGPLPLPLIPADRNAQPWLFCRRRSGDFGGQVKVDNLPWQLDQPGRLAAALRLTAWSLSHDFAVLLLACPSSRRISSRPLRPLPAKERLLSAPVAVLRCRHWAGHRDSAMPWGRPA